MIQYPFYYDAQGECTISQDKISKYDIASFYNFSFNLILIQTQSEYNVIIYISVSKRNTSFVV